MPIIECFEHLPGGLGGETGFVYLLEFSTGVTKVGSTVDPAVRVGQHLSASRGFGADLVTGWLSEPHPHYLAVEQGVLNRARMAGAVPVFGREWLRGVDFDSPVACAEAFVAGNGKVPFIKQPAGRSRVAVPRPVPTPRCKPEPRPAPLPALPLVPRMTRVIRPDLSRRAEAVLKYGLTRRRHTDPLARFARLCRDHVTAAGGAMIDIEDVREALHELSKTGLHRLRFENAGLGRERPVRTFSAFPEDSMPQTS